MEAGRKVTNRKTENREKMELVCRWREKKGIISLRSIRKKREKLISGYGRGVTQPEGR